MQHQRKAPRNQLYMVPARVQVCHYFRFSSLGFMFQGLGFMFRGLVLRIAGEERSLSRFDGLVTPLLVVGLLSGACQNPWFDTDVFW
jgi:hypothetical protein